MQLGAIHHIWSCTKRLAILACAPIFIIACGPPTPVYQVQHALTPPASDTGRLCASQCLNTKQHCVQNAQLRQTIDQDRCEERARREAHRKYKTYVARRRAQGKRIKRSEDDFYSGYSCKQKGKDDGFCLESYHQCYTTCGGQVASKSICVANCDVPTTQTGSITQSGTVLAATTHDMSGLQSGAALPVEGKWAITQQACASSNASQDGVLHISKSQIQSGLDLCVVDNMTPAPSGMYHFKTRCQSSEGDGTYTSDFFLSAPTASRLTWDNRKYRRIEQLVRCI